jgi:hypothetical protein
VTSGANSKAGVPARATVGVVSCQDCTQIFAPAHRNFRSARWSHSTNKKTHKLRRLLAQNVESAHRLVIPRGADSPSYPNFTFP